MDFRNSGEILPKDYPVSSFALSGYSGADDEVAASGFLAGNELSGWDGLKIYVTGNEERIVISSQFDNLGKVRPVRQFNA